jgi:hypothetical protein
VAGPATAHKHTDLELALIRLADAQARTDTGLNRVGANLDRLEANLDRYAAEMRERQAQTEANLDRYAAEMRERQAQTEVNLDRLQADMRDSAARSEREWKELRRQLGEEANRRGRLVEDVLAPSVPDIFRQVTGWQGDVTPAVRQWRGFKGDPARLREFDLVAWAGESFLYLEAKSTVKPESIDPCIDVARSIRDYFPEAVDRQVYAGLASFYLDDSIVTAIERQRLLAVGLGGGLAEVLNSPGFKLALF